MKLLEKRKINENVQSERKNVIDSGVFLAKKVDILRSDLLNLEKQRADFIEGSQEKLEEAIGDLKKERDNLSFEVKEAKKQLKKLREPLDEEWKRVEDLQEEVVQIKLDSEEYFQGLIVERQLLTAQRAKIDDLRTEAEANEHKTYKTLEKMEQDSKETKELAEQTRQLKELKEVELYTKETSLDEREKTLKQREETLKKERLELNKEKKLLAIKKQRIQ